ncbi:MAG: thiol reductant ABC exporter subunit CydC [Peptococcaceae bacterium]|nr:thiol reductant ABC exporter subunit CydC [Peptococcaceae bacterium]
MKEFLRLVRLTAFSWKGMLAATVFSFFTVSSNIGLLAVSALLISRAAFHPPVLDLMVLIVGVRFFGVSRAVFRYLERYVSHDVTFKILRKIRISIYEKLEPLAPALLMNYRSGDLLTNLVADVETLKEFYLRVLAPPLTAFLVLSANFVFLAWFDLRLAFLFLFFFLLAGIAVPLLIAELGRGVKERMVRVKAALNAQLVDSIQGMTEMIVYGQAERQRQETGKLNRELTMLQDKMAKLSGISQAATQLAMNLAFWSVLLAATSLVRSGSLDGVYLAMLALSTGSSFEAVIPLSLIYAYGEESLAAWKRIRNITSASPDVADHPIPAELRDYSVEIKDLRFRYDQGKPWILDGLNFVLPQGGRVGISGPSGAGKSTLVNILLRFYEYEEGSVLLGGQELKHLGQEDVRRLFGVVSQHTHLFNTTVRENLLLARPQASEDEMVRAAQKALVHDFIKTLPKGYDTYIGEGGFKLSGGQRQRLAIARVLLKEAPILILDEAEANLDAIAEREVMQSLLNMMEGRTTLVISHRRLILEKMDQVIVLPPGIRQEDIF